MNVNHCRFVTRPPTPVAQTNSTRHPFGASMILSQEDGMAYEWSGQRARRDRLWKVTTMIAATLVTVGIPTVIVLAAIAY